MTRTKLGLLGLCTVVFGAMAISAIGAQAATYKWLILNSSKTTATELKAPLTAKLESTHLTLYAEVADLNIAITFTALTLNNINLELNGRLTDGGKIVLTGCKVYKKAPLGEEYKCTVKTSGAATGTVETNELKGELELVGSVLLTKIEPKAGLTGNFATLRFEGAECVLPELNQLHGVLYLKDSNPTVHELEHLVTEDVASTALYIGGHSTTQLNVTDFLGNALISLTGAHSGLHWAAQDTP